ncbi:MAG: YdcF family protein [Eubacterium sp.]|nr:YdcF family protein [Eubacterium sp.]
MQIAFIIIGAVVFLCFFAAVFDGVLNFGNTVGMALGTVYIVMGLLINRLDFANQKLIVIIAVCLLFLLVLKMYEIYKVGKTTADSEDVVIVLGCRVKGDKPSLALIKRTDAAYRFLLNNPEAVAILSGGQGKDEKLSEALCMQKLLYDRGILKDRLILEDKSTSTDENIRFSLEIIEQLGMKKEAAIATSEYHQKRAAAICKRYGIKSSAVSSKTKLTLLPTFLLREMLGEIKEKLVRHS